MYLLENEGPFPIQAKLIGMTLQEEEGFLQAFMLLSEVQEIPTGNGWTAMGFLKEMSHNNYRVPLANVRRIEKLLETEIDDLGDAAKVLSSLSTANPLAAAGPNAKSPVDVISPAPPYQRDNRGLFAPGSFEFLVRLTDIEGGVKQMRKNAQDDTWMVFLAETFKISPKTKDRSLALQYSVNNEILGLDWVLLGERNAADAEEITTLAQTKGHCVKHLTENDVNFLRIEDGDIASLGLEILSDFYGVSRKAQLGLIINGIWLSAGKRGVQ